jgi:hypothetical protein
MERRDDHPPAEVSLRSLPGLDEIFPVGIAFSADHGEAIVP